MSGLTIRHFQRRDLVIPIEFIVCDEQRDQVRFSLTSSAANRHAVTGQSVDISTGGMGILCRQFLPRMCEGWLRLLDPKPAGTRSDGSPIHCVIFEHRVKVRRVQMTSHEPAYFIGLSFIDPAEDLERHIEALVEQVQAARMQMAGQSESLQLPGAGQPPGAGSEARRA